MFVFVIIYVVISIFYVSESFEIRPYLARPHVLHPRLIHTINNCKSSLYSTEKTTDYCEPKSIIQPQHDCTSFIVDIAAAEVGNDEICDENIVKIVNLETSDQQSNMLVWKCLGYRYDPQTQLYDNSIVFPKWKAKYPEPPDLIGINRIYDPSIDKPIRDANMNLMRSVPRDYKAGVKNLDYVGFKGYRLNELTPNKTRRAQLVNWLIYYREYLHGKSFESLVQQREQEQKKDEDISNLPSEVMFQKLRLDENSPL